MYIFSISQSVRRGRKRKEKKTEKTKFKLGKVPLKIYLEKEGGGC